MLHYLSKTQVLYRSDIYCHLTEPTVPKERRRVNKQSVSTGAGYCNRDDAVETNVNYSARKRHLRIVPLRKLIFSTQ